MQVKFLGAAGTVTGSCYLLTSQSGQSILIDCGLFQGTQDLEKLNHLPFDCDCSAISAVVLTHAHLDHCGRLPMLLSHGFKGEMWMTPPTRDITQLSLFDSAKIGKEDNRPLYDKRQVEKTVALFRVVDYEKSFSLGNFEIVMRDAGHILGSASLEIVDQSATNNIKKIVFSGDLGNSPEDLIRPTELINSSDVVVLESTYGDRSHPADNPSDIIAAEINAIEASGGTLLIPAFSIERSQELLHKISLLKKSGKVKGETPVFFDSPMAEKVTAVFKKYRQYYNLELEQEFKDSDPFVFPGLLTVANRNDSLEIIQTTGPKVIVAGSGMMTGGRIMGHALRFLPESSTRLLIVGYQGEGTLGRIILDGQRNISIQGNSIIIRANINQTQAMSSHADQPRLLSWLKNILGVKKIFLTHGEDGPRTALAEKIKTDLGTSDISLPIFNQQVGF